MTRIEAAADEDSVSNHSRECQRMEWPAIIYESGRRCLPSWLLCPCAEALRPRSSATKERQITATLAKNHHLILLQINHAGTPQTTESTINNKIHLLFQQISHF